MRLRGITYFAGGGSAFLLAIFTLVFLPSTAAGQGGGVEVETRSLLAGACACTYTVLLLGLLAVIATLVGLALGRGESAWPHWRRLVAGLGQAAFLVALLNVFAGLNAAYAEIVRLGAAVTPADMWRGLQTVFGSMTLGCLAALASLVGAGLLRLVEKRSP